jgi:hypothetical protein
MILNNNNNEEDIIMKSKETLKTDQIKIVLSYDEKVELIRNAKMNGMSVSELVRDYCIKNFRNRHHIDAETLCKITNIANMAKDVLDKTGDEDLKEWFRKEVDELWSYLK